ncbi:hypothetical protein [Pseudoxanthomonas putridarboris]|uniref:Uncharacterized protein n=1 Tax=Pseudoxanthomonas putridarboris TaxID=752605 RepID=A0ABU9J0C0_9GAMM
MVPYQVMVEGVFVCAPELEENWGGFQTTFFLNANNAPNAAHRVRELLAARMSCHGVWGAEDGVLKSYYWIHNIWEITEERFLQEDGKDTGFTFFRIRWYEKFQLALRRIYFNRFKPWLLVPLPRGGGGILPDR